MLNVKVFYVMPLHINGTVHTAFCSNHTAWDLNNFFTAEANSIEITSFLLIIVIYAEKVNTM